MKRLGVYLDVGYSPTSELLDALKIPVSTKYCSDNIEKDMIILTGNNGIMIYDLLITL